MSCYLILSPSSFKNGFPQLLFKTRKSDGVRQADLLNAYEETKVLHYNILLLFISQNQICLYFDYFNNSFLGLHDLKIRHGFSDLL